MKSNRRMEESFKILCEMLRDERAEGKAESVIELLQEIGSVSTQLQERIINEKDMSILIKPI